MAESDQGAADRFVPENIRVHRERRDMSRSTVAEAMRMRRGHKWHPNTVARIEAGERRVNVGELADIAAILGTTMDRLLWPPEENAGEALAVRAIGGLREAADEAAWSVARLHTARAAAGRAAAQAARSKYQSVRDLAAEVSRELDGATLEIVLADAVARWEHIREGGT